MQGLVKLELGIGFGLGDSFRCAGKEWGLQIRRTGLQVRGMCLQIRKTGLRIRSTSYSD